LKTYRFSRNINKDFATTLRKRVNAYFQENNLPRTGNWIMKLKALTAMTMYFGPFILILSLGSDSILLLLALWLFMGVGKAFMGTSVMHDALHGTFSSKHRINRIMGFSSVLLGADARMWKIQHNVLHHTYTNVEEMDEDIEVRYFLRFSPNQPRHWFHRFQHIYAPLFYSISTIFWSTAKDFIKLHKYYQKGIVKSKQEYSGKLTRIILGKLLYFAIFLALPIWLVPVAPWITILMFLAMHMVAGLTLSLIFQLAHVVPSSDFVEVDGSEIQENWSVHQLLTTANFATKSKTVGWFTGGLNFQIEHHLFPNICHVHYPKIAEIVRATAQEFNIPYHMGGTLKDAVMSHFIMLRTLGRHVA
jgi:linoleoyl-CoA desaturase